MAKRVRSPSYPSVPLMEAVELVNKIHGKNRTNVLDREAAVKDMGYSGLTGRSGKLLATLTQYGLIERAGKGGVKVTQIAVDILHPQNDADQARALREAAFHPDLFAALQERFPDGVPSDNALRSHLMREGFATAAIAPTVNSFLETCRFLQQKNAYESHGVESPNEASYQPQQPIGDRMRAEPNNNNEVRGNFPGGQEIAAADMMPHSATGRANRVRIILDDGKLHISGENVDLKGVDKLKQMLAKYEEILKLSESDEDFDEGDDEAAE